jgi:hypothetical protein
MFREIVQGKGLKAKDSIFNGQWSMGNGQCSMIIGQCSMLNANPCLSGFFQSCALHPFFLLTSSPGKMYDAGVGEIHE